MKIMALNFGYVDGGFGSPKERMQKIATYCQQNQVDVVALQEAPGGYGNWLRYGMQDGVATLAQMLGRPYASAVCWSNVGYVADFRIGVVSRWPIEATKIIEVAGRKQVMVRTNSLNVASVHLNPQREQQGQMSTLLVRAPKIDIIAGDLNTEKLTELFERGFQVCENAALTHANGILDWILARGLQVYPAIVVDMNVSDHKPVVGVVG